MDPDRPVAGAVAVKSGLIQLAGDAHQVRELCSRSTRTIDCQGATVVPGFNDAHCHPLALASNLLSVDCSPASVQDIAGIQEKISLHARDLPQGRWIKATGYNEFYLAEKRHPNRWDLDKAAPHHKVRLTHRSGHACVLNSLAMEALGIGMETPEPPGGIIERDLDSGKPNGLLFEMNSIVDQHIPPWSKEEIETGLRLAGEHFLSRGVTSLTDATWTDTVARWHLLREARARDFFRPKVTLMTGVDDLPFFSHKRLLTGDALGKANSGIRLGGVKIVLGTATGTLSPPQQELNSLLYRIHEAGYQVCVHAVEQDEVEAAVNALEYVLLQSPRHDHRHRIEHCSVCPPALMQRIATLELLVVSQPSFVYYSGERYLNTVPAADIAFLYPFRSLLNKGVKLAAGSDTPVVPLDPMAAMYAAITRSTESGHVLSGDQGISALATLEMHTTAPAHAAFEERHKGRIAAGMTADLALLSADPTQPDHGQLKDIRVLMTILDGKVVWKA